MPAETPQLSTESLVVTAARACSWALDVADIDGGEGSQSKVPAATMAIFSRGEGAALYLGAM